jgi:hypothetical protein
MDSIRELQKEKETKHLKIVRFLVDENCAL